MSIIYIDVETTGLDPERHEVIEIGWVDGYRSAGTSFLTSASPRTRRP